MTAGAPMSASVEARQHSRWWREVQRFGRPILAIDAAVVALHVVADATPPPDPPMLLLDSRFGLGAIAQIALGLVGVFCLALMGHRRRSVRPLRRAYLAWTSVILLAVVADATEIHIAVAESIDRLVPSAWIGDATILVVTALFAFPALVYAIRVARGASPDWFVAVAVAISGGLFLISGFGFDLLHDLVGTSESTAGRPLAALAELVFDVLEEGGELLAFSIVAAAGLSALRVSRPRS